VANCKAFVERLSVLKGSVGLPIESTDEHAKTSEFTKPEEKKYKVFAELFTIRSLKIPLSP
jgi:hypothetical protein